MNVHNLLTLFAALPPLSAGLVKLTILIALGWLAHASLLRRNPRWRVALWRGVAVGLILMPAALQVIPAIRIVLAVPVASASAVTLSPDSVTQSLPAPKTPASKAPARLSHSSAVPTPPPKSSFTTMAWLRAHPGCLV